MKDKKNPIKLIVLIISCILVVAMVATLVIVLVAGNNKTKTEITTLNQPQQIETTSIAPQPLSIVFSE